MCSILEMNANLIQCVVVTERSWFSCCGFVVLDYFSSVCGCAFVSNEYVIFKYIHWNMSPIWWKWQDRQKKSIGTHCYEFMILLTSWTSAGLSSSQSCCCSVMVWTEIKLPFNPPPLHMTSPWCTSHRELSLVRCVFSSVTCSQSELLSSASTPTGQPVVKEWREREENVSMNGNMEERTLVMNKPKYWQIDPPHRSSPVLFSLSYVTNIIPSHQSCGAQKTKIWAKEM